MKQFCCEYIHEEEEVIKHYSQNTKQYCSKSLQTKKTLDQQNPILEEKDKYQKFPSMSNQENIDLNIKQEEEIKPSIFLVQYNNQEKQTKKLENNQDCDKDSNPQQIIDKTNNISPYFKSQTKSNQQQFDLNRNSITAYRISDNKFANNLTQSQIQNLSALELVQSQSDCQNQLQTKNLYQFPDNFDDKNERGSLKTNSYLSKAQVLKVLCKYCDQWVSQNYIQLECQHNYCIECFKEELKQQCQTSECIKFYCRCTIKISEKTILQLRNQLIPNILNKLRQNQLSKLTLQIQKFYKTWTCPNRKCQFICIIQENQNTNLFYCPNCSKNFPVNNRKQ